MSPWPWYAVGLALAAVMVGHWLAIGRMMAVSGRYTAVVNRLRFGKRQAEAPANTDDLLAALRAATAAEFGASAVEPHAAAAIETAGPRHAAPAEQPMSAHALFFACVVVGGLASSLLSGTFVPSTGLRGEGLARLAHGSPAIAAVVLLAGGVLVGFGTRMSGGCTSGHGLCGASRLQKASLLATAAFFGAGVVTSLLIGRLG